MKRIRLGIVGCGIAARDLHFPALRELTDKFEITALTSRTKEHTENFAKMVFDTLGYKPKVFDTYDELLSSGEVETVDLTLPIELNVPFTKKAIEKGIHVICEKPISTDIESGKELVDLSVETDKVIYIAENYRHAFKYNKLRGLIDEGAVDFISTLFEFENGVIANYTACYSIKSDEYFEIVGTEGKIRLTPQSIVVSGKRDEKINLIQENTFKKEFEDFYQILTTGKENILGHPVEALKDLSFFEAAIKSKGERVFIPALLK